MGALIERMARAMCIEDGVPPDNLAYTGLPALLPGGYGYYAYGDARPAWTLYYRKAHQALAAILEPTEAQYEALSATGKAWREMNSAFVWKTYIEAELKEP